jgi:hypothetical protein
MAGTCPPTSIQTFPNVLNLPSQNIEFYTKESTYEPTQIEFQWAEQRTPSQFVDSLKGILAMPTGPSNTLRYKNATYSLTKLQVTDPTHTSWILPVAAQSENQEDMIFTFTAQPGPSGPVSPEQIIIVVPILRSTTLLTTDPNFFKMMGPLGSYDFSKPASLSEFFPASNTATVLANTIHLYYPICSSGKNILVIVQPFGLRVSNTVMNLVKQALNSVSGKFGPYEPIDGTTFPSSAGVIDEERMKSLVKYGYRIGERVETQAPPTLVTKIQPADAFKCVPFDPETQLKDGKIVVDATTGEPISQIEADRADAKKEAEAPANSLLAAESFVKVATIGLGAFFAVMAVLILIYLFMSAGGGMGAGEGGGSVTRFVIYFFNQWFTPILVICIAAFIGFIVGMMMR